jgi:hypothetical protein
MNARRLTTTAIALGTVLAGTAAGVVMPSAAHAAPAPVCTSQASMTSEIGTSLGTVAAVGHGSCWTSTRLPFAKVTVTTFLLKGANGTWYEYGADQRTASSVPSERLVGPATATHRCYRSTTGVAWRSRVVTEARSSTGAVLARGVAERTITVGCSG